MQTYLLTILILLPVIGAATAVIYSFTPGARESHYRWIALGFTTVLFFVSLLLIRGAGGGAFHFTETIHGLLRWVRAITSESTASASGWSF